MDKHSPRVPIALATLLLAWLALVVPVRAVELSAGGIGDVLLFPYYTVQSTTAGEYVSLLSLTNQSDRVKAARVRFHSGREGVPVLEFNLYLRPRDSWVAALLRVGEGAGIVTPDRSCTYPPISTSEAALTPLGKDPLTGVDLLPADQAREGYVEVMELGDYGPGTDAPPGSVAAAVMLPTSGVGTNVPVDCSRVATDDGGEATGAPGSLSGYLIQISVMDGLELMQAPVALANFNTERALFARPDTGRPTLADASPPVSVLQVPELGTVHTRWANPVDAVSAVLMRSAVSGDYVLDAVTRSQTSWVLTMPTRRHHVAPAQAPRPPFASPSAAPASCELVRSEILDGNYDREGRRDNWSSLGVPPPYISWERGLCWASTVVSLEWTWTSSGPLFPSQHRYRLASNLYGSVLSHWENGWMRIPLHVDPTAGSNPLLVHEMTGGATTILRPDGTHETRPGIKLQGLPVIGFVATSYRNEALLLPGGASVQSNYAGSVPLRYEISAR